MTARPLIARPRHQSIAALLTSLLLTAPLALAQPDSPAAAAEETAPAVAQTPVITSSLTPELVESKIKEAEASSTLDEEAKKGLVEQYRTVLTNLQQLAAFNVQAADYKEAIERGPEEAARIRAELDAASEAGQPAPPVALPADATLQDVERLLAREQAGTTSIEAQLAEVDKVLEEVDKQPTVARKRLGAAKLELQDIDAELKRALPEGLSPVDKQVRQWVLESGRDALRAEVLMLDQQILSAGARTDLNLLRRERGQQELKALKARRAYLENEADRLRHIDAQQVRAETEAAEAATAGAHPIVKQIVKQNAALSDAITGLTGRLDRLDDEQAKIDALRGRIEEDFRSTKQRIEAAGLNRALGQVLIEQRGQLPELRTYRKESAQRAESISDATLNQIRYREELRRLRATDEYLDTALAALPEAQRAAVRAELRAPVERRKDLLKRLISIEDSYLRGLTELDYDVEQLVQIATEYDDYLAERLLWVRSIVPITQQGFGALPFATIWLIAPTNWLEVGDVLLYELLHSALLLLGLSAFAILLWKTRAIKDAIRASAEPLRRVSTDRFGYTLQALGLTLLLAVPWPLLIMLIGWRLNLSLEATAFTKAIGQALVRSAVALFYLRAFRLLCIPGGVADRHFRWNADTLQLLRRNFNWATLVLIPIGFVAAAVYHHQDPAFSGTLGRLSLVAFMIGLAVFTARVLNPSRGAFKHMLAEHPEGWGNRLRRLWYPMAAGVPLALAVMVLAGYLYTAATLLESLIRELWVVLALVVAHQVIVRWLIVARRSLALKAALERRASREAQRDADVHGGEAAVAAEAEVDLAALDGQTRRLINTLIVIAGAVSLWLIWSEVLPALNMFERITLWSYAGTVDGTEAMIPVTLADLGLILIIAILATAAAKNLPALIEILLLRNTSVTAGSRYAVTTLTGYAITGVGVLLVFSTLGLSWGQVQWLVAALSVGIGFGLQEIVANFISGLIILFERPVRVGDIVSIGDTTGKVSKIEIRATTVRNWDKQELLVPNKEFITGRLLNWSLSDQVNRVVIPVGVEYGCDAHKARQLLAEVAAENPRVMRDPEPVTSFEGFGDNALTLVLRCYLESLEYRLAVTTELHHAIDDRFRAAGIGIAFPQRDIHVHAAQPLDIRLTRAERAGAAPTGSSQSPPPGGDS